MTIAETTGLIGLILAIMSLSFHVVAHRSGSRRFARKSLEDEVKDLKRDLANCERERVELYRQIAEMSRK